jgi:hypothetical protein
MCTGNATEDHAANKTVPSAPEDPAPTLPHESAASAAVLYEADSVDDEIVATTPPMHLVDAAAKGLALITSAAADAAGAERTTEAANISVPEITAGPEGSLCHPSEEAETLACAVGNSQPVAELECGTTKRRSERPARKRGVRPLITIANSPGTFFLSFSQLQGLTLKQTTQSWSTMGRPMTLPIIGPTSLSTMGLMTVTLIMSQLPAR